VIVLGIAATTVLMLGGAGFVLFTLRTRLQLGRYWLVALLVLGAAAASVCHFVESWLWSWTGLNPERGLDRGTGALVAMMVLAVPLEEASKLLAVWPSYQSGQLRDRADGVVAAVTAAAGFAIAECVWTGFSGPANGLFVARSLLGGVAHLLFAGAWGFVLSDASGGRFLRRAWLLAVVFHGLFDHIVYGRGPGTLVVAAPLLLGMLGLAGLGLREARTLVVPHSDDTEVSNEPTFDLIRQAVTRRDKPFSLFWIVAGALVTTGVALAALTLAVYVGHHIGIDFAAADEGDVRGNAPLLLLGAAAMSAFPLAGYLIARASGTESVLEPALGAAAAIAVVALLLSLATQVALVFSLAVAPVAFGLSCVGAWFGMGK
jgi:RsiW-degrading membrane proteinase PrsW (M82 family)